MTIQEKYEEKVATPSDINQLLPFLKEYAEKCETICEMGVRDPTSTYAFLAAKPKKIVSYDIGRYPTVDLVEELAKAEGLDFTFILADVLKVEIEEADMIFIDTFHSKLQLERELALHSHKAKKYIGFHDVATFWENAEGVYDSASANQVDGKEGLRYAIEPFLKNNPQWKEVFRTDINNGLLIIER